MTTSDLPPLLLIACFALLVLALAQLARIQKEAIGHLRGISSAEAEAIYRRDYTDGDGATFKWREMRDYCRSTDQSARLRRWIVTGLAALAGGIGSIFLDQALR